MGTPWHAVNHFSLTQRRRLIAAQQTATAHRGLNDRVLVEDERLAAVTRGRQRYNVCGSVSVVSVRSVRLFRMEAPVSSSRSLLSLPSATQVRGEQMSAAPVGLHILD